MQPYIVTSSIALSTFLALYYLLLQRESMHRFNRFYLLGAVAASLILPFVNIPIYIEVQPATVLATPMPVAVSTTAAVAHAAPVIAAAPQSINYLPYILWGLYGVVALALGVRFALNIVRFYRIKKHSSTIAHKGTTVVVMDTDVPPHTFLGSIFVSRSDYENRHAKPELFTHELAHVYQRHTLDILFIEAVKTVLWFNPLLYFYKRAIQLNHEFLADAATLSTHHSVTNYQSLLLSRAQPALQLALASSINFSVTKKRFLMMTKTTAKGKALLLKLAALPVLAGLVYALSTETVARERDFKHTGAPQTVKDTTDYRKKRDAYYSGVTIVIDDQANNVYINKPYEQLSEAEKDRYYLYVPEGTGMKSIPGKEYAKLQNKKGYYVEIDGRPIDNSELLKHKPEEFVHHTFVTRAKESLTKERPQIFEYSLYTLPYYNTHIKTQEKAHYPDSIFSMSITKVYKDGKVVAAAKPAKVYNVKASKKYSEKDVVNYTGVDKMPQYPGGIEKITGLLAAQFNAPETANPDITTYYLTVIIEPNGQLGYAKVLNAEDEATALEMIRILKTADNWTPGTLNGKAVRTSYTFKVNLN
jgi:beta-lactamase regulating signal transducer with metallopeptidase domain